MRPSSIPRKRQLRAALSLAGKSLGEFCADIGISRTHLTLVLTGERPSRRVEAEVDALIEQYLGKSAA